jgi:hypothetical protein
LRTSHTHASISLHLDSPPMRLTDELLNNAVLISSEGRGVAAAIAASALHTWELRNFSHEWGLLGPRAVTEAWVQGRLGAPSSSIYAAETFGFSTCARRATTATTVPSPKPAGMNTLTCTDFSGSDLPIDCPVEDVDWDEYLKGRLAQHGIKTLIPSGIGCSNGLWTFSGPASDYHLRSIRGRLARRVCPATASKAGLGSERGSSSSGRTAHLASWSTSEVGPSSSRGRHIKGGRGTYGRLGSQAARDETMHKRASA